MSIKLMNAAWMYQGLNSGQKLVLLSLCDNASDEGHCFPAIHTTAEKCSLSERAVQGHIAHLESLGLLSRHERPGRSTYYTLHPRRICTPAESAPPQNLHPTPAESAPPPPQNLHPTPAESAPITINEPSIEPSGNHHPEKAFAKFWDAYPKKQGKGMAEKAWKKLKAPAATLQAILEALEWQRQSQQWLAGGGQYIPMPSTYLNGRRWEDAKPDDAVTQLQASGFRPGRGVQYVSRQQQIEEHNARVAAEWAAQG